MQLELTLLVLSLTYACFTLPLLLIKFSNTSPYNSMVFDSIYCWMYAINEFIYVATCQDFRNIYKLFKDDFLNLAIGRIRAPQRTNTSNSSNITSNSVLGSVDS